MLGKRFYSRKLLLLAGDALLLFVALFVSLRLRSFFTDNPLVAFHIHAWAFAGVFFVWLLMFYWFDLYNLRKIRSLAFNLSTFLIVLPINTLLAAIIFYFFEAQHLSPKTLLVFLALVTYLILVGWRYLYARFFLTNVRTRVAIIGVDEARVKRLVEVMNPDDNGYEMAGLIHIGRKPDFEAMKLVGLGEFRELSDIIKKGRIEELVCAFSYHENQAVANDLLDAISMGVTVSEFPHFYETATGKVPLESIDQTWFLSNLDADKRKFDQLARVVDVVLASMGLILVAPFLPLIWLAIRLDSSGQILYSQVRCGFRRKNFRIYKFRSMRDNAEAETGAVWSGPSDARITRVGRFLRRARIDEIPQLVNVLRGEMSFVGPRPERPEFTQTLSETIPFYNRRLMVRPGLTGWAQIRFRYTNTPEETMEKLQYDLFYIKNRSLLLYLMIMMKTVRIMVTRVGV